MGGGSEIEVERAWRNACSVSFFCCSGGLKGEMIGVIKPEPNWMSVLSPGLDLFLSEKRSSLNACLFLVSCL